MVYYIEKPGKPDAPEITTITDNSVSLSYKPPESDGGSEIFNYVIEYRLEGGLKWVRANMENVPALKYTVKGLMKDTIYEFRISAENRAGVGPASDPTAPVQAKEPLSMYTVLSTFIHYLQTGNLNIYNNFLKYNYNQLCLSILHIHF